MEATKRLYGPRRSAYSVLARARGSGILLVWGERVDGWLGKPVLVLEALFMFAGHGSRRQSQPSTTKFWSQDWILLIKMDNCFS